MKNKKSQAERSLENILRDSESSASSLSQLLPQPSFSNKSEQIKRNISDFIQNCFVNNPLVIEMIERGIKSVNYQTQYQKKLALFSVEMLSGDYGDSYKLFIEGQQMKELLRTRSLKNQSEIEQQIQMQSVNPTQNFNKKYGNFMYLLEYIRKNSDQIPEINMSYFVKILSNIITNKSEEVYVYFNKDHNNKHPNMNADKPSEVKQEEKKEQASEKSDIQYLIEHSYHFGGISEMLAKMVVEQGAANNFLNLKLMIIEKFLQKLKSEQLLKSSPNNYNYLLQFASYLLSRTKYRSDDSNQQIAKISQKFVDENVIWFFKEKAVKSAIDSNGLLSNNFMNSSGTLGRSESSKSAKRQNELRPENQQQFFDLELTFENSIEYLRIIAERINSEEQMDSFENESAEPTMDFQVDEALYGQNSLYQLFTLHIPFIYKSMNKMSYYELLLKITRNSRFQKSKPENQIGLLPSFLIPILIHLLKVFRRESRRNGLVNLYVEQLISQAVLPRIEKFDNKEAMMILSALNPSEEVLLKFDDTRTFTQKMVLIMAKKCDWFSDHFQKLGIDLAKIRQKFKTRLGNNDYSYQNKKPVVKQLLFLADEPSSNGVQIGKEKIQKNDRIQDSDSDEQKELKEWNPVRKFEFPKGFGDEQEKTQQNKVGQLQKENNSSEIVQQIQISFSEGENEESLKKQYLRKQSEIELMVDSAEEDEEVLRQDMKPQPPS